MSRPLLGALAALLLVACSPITAPRREPAQLTVAPVGSPEAPEGATTPPTVRPRSGALDVLGIISTPYPCYDIDASVETDASRVDIEIVARGRNVICIASLGAFAYRVSVDDLDPGVHQVRVTYRYPDTGWPTTTALETSVTVP